jgi:hypothetical protein
MKLQMKREALVKLNRQANEMAPAAADVLMAAQCAQSRQTRRIGVAVNLESALE